MGTLCVHVWVPLRTRASDLAFPPSFSWRELCSLMSTSCPPRCHPGDLPQASDGLSWGGDGGSLNQCLPIFPLLSALPKGLPHPSQHAAVFTSKTSWLSPSLVPTSPPAPHLNLAFTLGQIYQTSFCSQHTTSSSRPYAGCSSIQNTLFHFHSKFILKDLAGRPPPPGSLSSSPSWDPFSSLGSRYTVSLRPFSWEAMNHNRTVHYVWRATLFTNGFPF